MYCIKCGVELTDGQKKCPLCNTEVYHPDFISKEGLLFPKGGAPQTEYNRIGILFVISVLYFIAMSVLFVCDITVFHRMTWSRYVISALLLTYVIIVLPLWFKSPNPVIFVPCDFGATAVFLWFISFIRGESWFFTFALPITLGICIISTTMITLKRYVRRGFLYTLGGGFIATGLFTVLIEFLIRLTFFDSIRFIWSFYPALVFFLLGMMLIVVAICKPMRRSLEKIFFI
ncbi:MAG: hypothetical protein IJ445_02460 [Clostridia bacterium]|nr:hypothetical protein [Clostridia bacterium]